MKTVEIPKKVDESSVSGREIKIEIPAFVELSEEEIKKIADAVENEIVDVIRGAQARLKAKSETVSETVNTEVKAKAGIE